MLEIKLDATDLERGRILAQKFPALVRAAMRKANLNSSATVLNVVKQTKLVGGNPLNRRTGNLIRSWAVRPPVEEEDGWRGGIGSNSDYAAAHEFGVDKTQNVGVRAHTRRVTQVFGRPVRGIVANVSAFQRAQHTKLPPRPYARPALHESIEKIREHHSKAVTAAWLEAKP